MPAPASVSEPAMASAPVSLLQTVETLQAKAAAFDAVLEVLAKHGYTFSQQ